MGEIHQEARERDQRRAMFASEASTTDAKQQFIERGLPRMIEMLRSDDTAGHFVGSDADERAAELLGLMYDATLGPDPDKRHAATEQLNRLMRESDRGHVLDGIQYKAARQATEADLAGEPPDYLDERDSDSLKKLNAFVRDQLAGAGRRAVNDPSRGPNQDDETDRTPPIASQGLR